MQMAKPVMITAEGLKQLEEELEYLKGQKRKEVAEKIKVARSYGDLSENSEYDDAKNEQAILEARIVTIEATLKNAVLIDEEGISNEHVHVGSSVRLLNLRTDSEVTYKIVGSNEANPSDGKISDESPVGAALIGHSVGDAVEVEVPVGVIGFKVLEIFK
ncbi:MAG: transcription elongation factor GreA [Ruminococcus sp.]|nr:transcription elongation factor GreA [Ruminococcus sp.]